VFPAERGALLPISQSNLKIVEQIVFKKYSGLVLIGTIVVLLFFGLADGGQVLVAWLWMAELGYAEIFWWIFLLKGGIFGLTLIVVFVYLWFNLRLGAKNCGVSFQPGQSAEIVRFNQKIRLPSAWSRIGLIFLAFLAALIFALALYPSWDTCLRSG
jgi:uncharacterized membrane protein (UPF0182 family)